MASGVCVASSVSVGSVVSVGVGVTRRGVALGVAVRVATGV